MIPFLPESHPLQRAAMDPAAVLWGQHLNERQRNFAVAIMAGKSRTEALQAAGFHVAKENRDSRACHLLAHPSVRRYTRALRGALWKEAAQEFNCTLQTLEQAKVPA